LKKLLRSLRLCGEKQYLLIFFQKFPDMRKLPRAFYDRDTIAVARDLLGKYLVHISRGVERVGRIVEVEAYLGPHDLAAHSARGLTERTQVMFGPPGHAYVYMIYGMYFCMNVVTEREGHASAILLRAIEPVTNIDERTQGPGLLCRAMRIDKRLNGYDLTGNNFYIAAPAKSEPVTIVKRPRVGVDYAGHWARRHLRFYIKGNPFVSKR
jgi:DNA-3-methyladenine glycosylase